VGHQPGRPPKERNESLAINYSRSSSIVVGKTLPICMTGVVYDCKA
jgi:hypothetical protein